MTRDDTFVEQLENYLDEYEGLTPLPDLVRDDVRAALPSTNQVGPMPGLRRYFTSSALVPLSSHCDDVDRSDSVQIDSSTYRECGLFGDGANRSTPLRPL